jgi:hypothetical protein
MFFDEPLTGLDPLAIRKTKDLIVKRAKDGVAILISSHLLHLLEEVCSHVLILRRGERAAYGTLQAVLAEFGNGAADCVARGRLHPGGWRRRWWLTAMNPALLYLFTRSFWNSIVSASKRLRQPKYLIGAIIGGAYFYFYFYRFLFRGDFQRTPTPINPRPGFELSEDLRVNLAALGLFVAVVVFGWIIPSSRAALTFSEAEIAWLFPAPVSRAQLIRFRFAQVAARAPFPRAPDDRHYRSPGARWSRSAAYTRLVDCAHGPAAPSPRRVVHHHASH